MSHKEVGDHLDGIAGLLSIYSTFGNPVPEPVVVRQGILRSLKTRGLAGTSWSSPMQRHAPRSELPDPAGLTAAIGCGKAGPCMATLMALTERTHNSASGSTHAGPRKVGAVSTSLGRHRLGGL